MLKLKRFLRELVHYLGWTYCVGDYYCEICGRVQR